MKLSISKIADLLKIDRRTATKQLQGHRVTVEARDHLYESSEVLVIRQVSEEESEQKISPQEASRRLTIAKEAEINLGMEVTRRERIPLDLVDEVTEEALAGIVGVLKSHVGKTLTEEALNDALAGMREVGVRVREKGGVSVG